MLIEIIRIWTDSNAPLLVGVVWFLRYMEEDARRLEAELASLYPARAVARYRCR